jgi:hypothetical protein
VSDWIRGFRHLSQCHGPPRISTLVATHAHTQATASDFNNFGSKPLSIRPGARTRYGSANELFKAPALAMILPPRGSETDVPEAPRARAPGVGPTWNASTV